MSRKDYLKAIDTLKPAVPYELGLPSASAFVPAMYPIYVRGMAYLHAHMGAEAEVEFEKLIRWRGVVVNEPIGVLAHLGLHAHMYCRAITQKPA